MILIISCCKISFSEEEFVRPIIDIIRNFGQKYCVRKYYENICFNKYEKIIISGTALMDSDYLNYIKNFEKLKDFEGKVLGICAGYQILARIYENILSKIEKIGVYRVKIIRKNPLIEEKEFYAYFLHRYALRNTNNNLEILAKQNDEICMFKVVSKDFYGLSFSPEVLNKYILENFARL